jgi:hypothetical protein
LLGITIEYRILEEERQGETPKVMRKVPGWYWRKAAGRLGGSGGWNKMPGSRRSLIFFFWC